MVIPVTEFVAPLAGAEMEPLTVPLSPELPTPGIVSKKDAEPVSPLLEGAPAVGEELADPAEPTPAEAVEPTEPTEPTEPSDVLAAVGVAIVEDAEVSGIVEAGTEVVVEAYVEKDVSGIWMQPRSV